MSRLPGPLVNRLLSQFLSSEQPCEPKSLDVASKIRLENLRLRPTRRPFDSRFERKERKGVLRVGGNLCPAWAVILKSV